MSQLNEAMEESISNTDAIVKIKANEDYTYFTFVSDNEKLSLADALISTPYVMLGGIYSVFNGNPDAEINYEFVNHDTGQVIYASDSSEEFTEATTVPSATTTTAATTTVAENTTAAPVTTENVPRKLNRKQSRKPMHPPRKLHKILTTIMNTTMLSRHQLIKILSD